MNFTPYVASLMVIDHTPYIGINIDSELAERLTAALAGNDDPLVTRFATTLDEYFAGVRAAIAKQAIC